MMNGITVLSQSEIMNTPNWTYIITIIALIAFFVSMIITFSFHHNRIETIFGISSICCSILFNVGLFCMNFIEKPTGKYTYKVTISDEVNFVEFNNKYEIIDQDGLIYIIKEKETTNGFN